MASQVHGQTDGPSADELAKQLSNPVAALISVPIQENVDYGAGHGGWRSTTNIQPVVPISISEDWNLISRTIVPLIYQKDITGAGNNESGMGDIVQSLFFSPKEPVGGWILGAGPVFGIPVGSHEFSIDRWLAGPTAVVLKQQGPWTYGALVNHMWDVEGDSVVSATFLQPFCSWGGLGNGQTLTVNMENTYDWKSEQWTAPINLMYSKVTKWGNQMVSYGGGVRYYLDKPNGGPDWGFRLMVTFLFPK